MMLSDEYQHQNAFLQVSKGRIQQMAIRLINFRIAPKNNIKKLINVYSLGSYWGQTPHLLQKLNYRKIYLLISD